MDTVRALLIVASFFIVQPCYAAGQWAQQYYPNDFDGDRISDVCVWRPSTGEWYCVPSKGQVIPGWNAVGGGPGSVVQWGLPGDIPASGDYDGDNKTDPAVLRPSTMTWYVRKSTGGTMTVQWGLGGDIGLTGNFLGSGPLVDDFTVFRPSNSRVYCRTSTGYNVNQVMPGQISGTHGSFGYHWTVSAHIFTRYSGNKMRLRFVNCTTGFGNTGDYTLPSSSGKLTSGAYLPGDVAYDFVHFQNDVWTIYPGGNNPSAPPLVVTWGWGVSGDVPVKGDFDGDNLADLTVYNNGSWRVYSSGYFYGSPPPHLLPNGNPADYWYPWGQAGDIPIQ